MQKLKLVIIIEALVIVALIVWVAFLYFGSDSSNDSYIDTIPPSSLQYVSSSIYAGVLPPQSYLILNYQPLQNEIQSYITSNNLNVSIYLLNLRSGSSFGIQANSPVSPASLGKLFVAIVIMKKVEEGKLSLNTNLTITNSDRDSSSGELYAQPINSLSVRDLLHWMLADSDNTAALVLGNYVSQDDLQNLSTYLNYFNDYENYNAQGSTYYVTAKSVSNIFLSLYYSTILTPADSELILSDLTNTTFEINKYADLPENVTVAQKYGIITTQGNQQLHDCGIMYAGNRRLFYCVMTRNLDENDGLKVIGNIVNQMYEYTINDKIDNINL